MDNESHEPDNADALDADASSLPTFRRDGWTPFARRLFLEVVAETGRVNLACEYAGLTKQSAYALRGRDPMFAAGWDAAAELARAPLADEMYERAIGGVTETITRDGAVVAERHRFDSRLSIAVLHRLDKRCDRAVEVGSQHLNLVRHWDEWLVHVGTGDEQAARVLFGAAPHGQLSQLAESANPTTEIAEDESIDLSDRCWRDDQTLDEPVWMTDFPPPDGFDGYEEGELDDFKYKRECTPEEAELLDAREAAEIEEERAADAALRDAWFTMLKQAAAEPPTAPSFSSCSTSTSGTEGRNER